MRSPLVLFFRGNRERDAFFRFTHSQLLFFSFSSFILQCDNYLQSGMFINYFFYNRYFIQRSVRILRIRYFEIHVALIKPLLEEIIMIFLRKKIRKWQRR